jgi:hypothetical protein
MVSLLASSAVDHCSVMVSLLASSAVDHCGVMVSQYTNHYITDDLPHSRRIH